MNNESLLERTYRLLSITDLNFHQIASGAGVDREWLAKFKQRRINEPGVKKVQRVHDFLVAYEGIKASRTAPARSEVHVG
jgi:hypothetical protein